MCVVSHWADRLRPKSKEMFSKDAAHHREVFLLRYLTRKVAGLGTATGASAVARDRPTLQAFGA